MVRVMPPWTLTEMKGKRMSRHHLQQDPAAERLQGRKHQEAGQRWTAAAEEEQEQGMVGGRQILSALCNVRAVEGVATSGLMLDGGAAVILHVLRGADSHVLCLLASCTTLRHTAMSQTAAAGLVIAPAVFDYSQLSSKDKDLQTRGA